MMFDDTIKLNGKIREYKRFTMDNFMLDHRVRETDKKDKDGNYIAPWKQVPQEEIDAYNVELLTKFKKSKQDMTEMVNRLERELKREENIKAEV